MAENVYSTFFSNPIEALKQIFFSPNPAALEVGAAVSSVRAYGVDPGTGKLIAPQYAAAASAAGYDATNPEAFALAKGYEAADYFEAQYQRNLQDHPSLPSLPSLDSSGLLIALALGALVLFLLFKVVK